GLHASVPIYSGGLGVLAGDQCKAASDLGVPLVGVGLFYTKGYSDQRLRLDGWQEDAEERFDVAATPLERVRGPKGDPCLATVRLSGRPVSVGAWRVMVGRVPILLLDTDLEQNDAADRGLSHRLYAGGPDLRLRQEWILGVGGVRVLRTLGYDPAAWHANEGHAAFMLVERIRELVTRGTPFADAVRRVRATSVFTTHTPVPAGHDTFSLEQVEQCIGPVWQELGVARPRGRGRVLGQGARAGRRGRVGGAQPAQVPPDAEHQGAGAAALGGPVEGGPAPRGRGDPARSGSPHHRLRPPVRDLQAGRPDLPRSRPAAAPAGEPLAPGPDRVFRQGAPGRRARQAGAAARVRADAGSPGRGPDRVHRRLRHASRP